MKSRMKQPALVLPDAMKALLDLEKAIAAAGPSKRTLDLINLRASQINGCGYCVDMHARDLKQAGETDERLWSVAAWRESRLFSEDERTALALTEAATRIADRPDAVSDGRVPLLRRDTIGRDPLADRRHQRLEPAERRGPSTRRRQAGGAGGLMHGVAGARM